MRLARRDQRALMALAVAAALFLLIDLALLPAIDRLQEARQGLQVQELTLKKYRRAVASEAGRQSSLAELQQRVAAAEAGMLVSETAALAVAELQRTLKELAAANQLELAGTEFLPARPLDSSHTLVSTRFAVVGNVERLVNFLAALQSAPKALAVRTLTVASNPTQAEKRVNATLVVSGVLRAEKPTEKEKGKR